jgi:S2P endopeptidase
MVVWVYVALALSWVPLYAIKHLAGTQTYNNILQSYNITHSFGTVGWYTEYFEPLFTAISNKYRKIMEMWYTVGAVVGFVASIVCMFLLVAHVIYFAFKLFPAPVHHAPKPRDEIALVMLVPGVNVPVSDIPSLLFALIISAVVHEFGHAFAAAAENVKTEQVGFLMFFLFPSAYVAINTFDLERKGLKSKLRIYFAGVWHNMVLCILAYFLVFVFFSPASMPLTSTMKRGVDLTVKRVAETSPLFGSIQPGDTIYGVNDCIVTDSESWRSCLSNIVNHNRGHCITKEMFDTNLKENGLDCCTVDHERLLCFEKWGPGDKACLPARLVLQYPSCSINSAPKDDCETCIVPVGSHVDVVAVKVRDKHAAIFLGDLQALYQEVQVTDYVSRIGIPLYVLEFIHTSLNYILAISSALALLNLAPVYHFDGDKIYETIAQFFTYLYNDKYPIMKWYDRVRMFFTAMLVCNMLIALFNLVKTVL